MKLTLAFGANGIIQGGGADDVAPFAISGWFDVATNGAYWTKAYLGMLYWIMRYRANPEEIKPVPG